MAAEPLTLGEVEALFCARLRVGRSTFYESHRPFLPVVYGDWGKRPRVRRDVAEGLVGVAAAGLWAEYAQGLLRGRFPHLYPSS